MEEAENKLRARQPRAKKKLLRRDAAVAAAANSPYTPAQLQAWKKSFEDRKIETVAGKKMRELIPDRRTSRKRGKMRATNRRCNINLPYFLFTTDASHIKGGSGGSNLTPIIKDTLPLLPDVFVTCKVEWVAVLTG